MKRSDAIRASTKPNATTKQTARTDKQAARMDWITYVTRVLAFIGLWQVLANCHQWLTLWLQ